MMSKLINIFKGRGSKREIPIKELVLDFNLGCTHMRSTGTKVSLSVLAASI